MRFLRSTYCVKYGNIKVWTFGAVSFDMYDMQRPYDMPKSFRYELYVRMHDFSFFFGIYGTLGCVRVVQVAYAFCVGSLEVLIRLDMCSVVKSCVTQVLVPKLL